jgi:hypothetical protein
VANRFESPTTLEAAEKATKAAFIVAMISGAITAAVSILGVLGFDVWNLFEAGIIFGLGLGVYRKSRACAVLLIVYLIADNLYLWFGLKQFQGIIFSLIVFIFYLRGAQGAFAYHKLSAFELKPLRIIKEEDEQSFTVKTIVKFGGNANKPTSVIIAYYLHANGEQKGPIPNAEVQQLIEKGLPPDTLFWCEGMSQWRNISEFS